MKNNIAFTALILTIGSIVLSCNRHEKDSPISGIFRIESKSIKNPMIDTFYADQNHTS